MNEHHGYLKLLNRAYEYSLHGKFNEALDIMNTLDGYEYTRDEYPYLLWGVRESILLNLRSSMLECDITSGHVYVIEDAEKGIVKIGKSTNPQDRIKSIKSISCTKGREFISDKVDNALSYENKVHLHLKDSRVQGEWFSISFDDAVKVVLDYTSRSL